MGLKDLLSPEKLAEMVNPPNKISLSKIGKQFNISRQRIYQVLKEYKATYPHLFVEIKDPTKEEIQVLLDKNWSLRKIANHFNITVGRLKKCMDKYGLKKTFIKDQLTRDVLFKHYVEEEKSDEEIAQKYNCSVNTVMKLRYNNNIFEYMRKPLREKLTRDIFLELYDEKQVMLSQIAELFNDNIQNVIKLKKEYHPKRKRVKGVTDTELEQIKCFLIEQGVINGEKGSS